VNYYRQSLEIEGSWEVAYQIGLILLTKLKQPTQAVDYFVHALDIAHGDVLSLQPESLANIYLARMKCFEELGLEEHAK